MEQVNEQTIPAIEVPMSTGDKIALFRSLFRGRDYIYVLRWENGQGVEVMPWPEKMCGARGLVAGSV
ncbi:MAG: hypothetical protein KDI33_10850 [Halioglobus sp.]|nr:hypothetical protein [Halioglobus sp.]